MQIYQQIYFLEFLYLKMLNHALYFFIFIIYANIIFIFIFIFERLDHMQFKIKLYFLKNFFMEGNWFT